MCDCVTTLNKELLKDKRMPVLEMALGFDGTAFPYMSAMYLKGKQKKYLTILPTFCPFCGEEYARDRSEITMEIPK